MAKARFVIAFPRSNPHLKGHRPSQSCDTETQMSDAIIELEIRLAHYETVLGDLSDVVAKQQDQIDQLIAEVVRLREHHVEDNDSLQLPPEDTRPPHY